MRQEKTVTLTEIIKQGALASLRERSGLIHKLDTLLGFYLDERLRQLVRVASYQDGTLVLACTNSTVAGQLRYLSRIYMQQLRQHGELCDLVRIHAVIGRPTSTIPAVHKTGQALRRLSPATAELLLHLSEDLEGGEVSEALRRLARHTGESE
ncbi:MAG: DciA family protein [Moraxellaceae bacterium]